MLFRSRRMLIPDFRRRRNDQVSLHNRQHGLYLHCLDFSLDAGARVIYITVHWNRASDLRRTCFRSLASSLPSDSVAATVARNYHARSYLSRAFMRKEVAPEEGPSSVGRGRRAARREVRGKLGGGEVLLGSGRQHQRRDARCSALSRSLNASLDPSPRA